MQDCQLTLDTNDAITIHAGEVKVYVWLDGEKLSISTQTSRRIDDYQVVLDSKTGNMIHVTSPMDKPIIKLDSQITPEVRNRILSD